MQIHVREIEWDIDNASPSRRSMELFKEAVLELEDDRWNEIKNLDVYQGMQLLYRDALRLLEEEVGVPVKKCRVRLSPRVP